MLRKSVLFAITAVLMASTLPSAAQAQDDVQDRFRAAGEIQSVDLAESTFTLDTRRGEMLEIRVDDSTRFRSRGGEIEGLEDLQVGMRAAAAGVVRNGVYLAKVVAAAAPGDRPRISRAAGHVSDVNLGRSTFTILTRSGEELTLGVEPRTRWFSRDGSVDELGDLERGMLVRVAYVQTDSGPVALAIQVATEQERDEREARRWERKGRLRAPDHNEPK